MNIFEVIDEIYSLEVAQVLVIPDKAILDEHLKFRAEYDDPYVIKYYPEQFKERALRYLLHREMNYFGYEYKSKDRPAGFLIGRIPNFRGRGYRDHITSIRDYADYFNERRRKKREGYVFTMNNVPRGVRTKLFIDAVEHVVGVPLEKCAHLAFFKTMEKTRGKGYGKKLIIDFMTAAKKYTIVVFTDTNSDYGFYGHMGFAKVWDAGFTIKTLTSKERRFIYVYNSDKEVMKKYRELEAKLTGKDAWIYINGHP